MRMHDFRPGAAQLFPIIRQSLNKAPGMGGKIRVKVALGNGDVPEGFPVFILVFEPKLRDDAVPVEVLHHRHHEIPRTDREVDRVDDLEHDFRRCGSVTSRRADDSAGGKARLQRCRSTAALKQR